MGDPWQKGENWRVVERLISDNGDARLKYIFRDGTSQYVNFRALTYTEENIELTGDQLAQAPDLRVRR